ncbi:FmdB family zinc ribbon protein [Desulfovirgula thermocuniculi]|uniref:FmdB family zinc ribbon protein n=1 Tax=Desulfovirgula thermocuniculi TaxID=348842 RepID=UPI0004169388|nr:zinc ribbon domain-containing protein [Desulfovirgula thermocuniculi]
MPIYEFRCRRCGHRFEKLCAVGESGEAQECPSCRAVGAERLLSSFAALGGSRDNGGSTASSGCSGCAGKSCATCR